MNHIPPHAAATCESAQRTSTTLQRRSVRALLQRLAVAGALAGAVVAAHADVRYDFTALSTIEDDSFQVYSGSFTFVTSDFVHDYTELSPSQLVSCSVVTASGTPASCGTQQFWPAGSGIADDWDTIGFGTSTSEIPEQWHYFYFPAQAFTATGVYASGLLGAQQSGTLTVSAVPEAAVWAQLAAGLAAVGSLVRRRRGA